jgi:hypothetical protein
LAGEAGRFLSETLTHAHAPQAPVVFFFCAPQPHALIRESVQQRVIEARRALGGAAEGEAQLLGVRRLDVARVGAVASVGQPVVALLLLVATAARLLSRLLRQLTVISIVLALMQLLLLHECGSSTTTPTLPLQLHED